MVKMTAGPPEDQRTAKASTNKAYMTVGIIVAPHGLGGELWVKPSAGDPSRFLELTELYLLHPQKGALLYSLKNIRLAAPPRQKRAGKKEQQVLLILEGLEDRTAAESVVGCDLAIPMEQAAPLAADSYYLHQIIGLQVEDENGVYLGEVVDIFSTAAHDIYVVRQATKEWYLPAIKEIILKVDLKAGKLLVSPPPGLLEINE